MSLPGATMVWQADGHFLEGSKTSGFTCRSDWKRYKHVQVEYQELPRPFESSVKIMQVCVLLSCYLVSLRIIVGLIFRPCREFRALARAVISLSLIYTRCLENARYTREGRDMDV
jgi:hypothetical protein